MPQVQTSRYGKKIFKYAAAVLRNSFQKDFTQVNK